MNSEICNKYGLCVSFKRETKSKGKGKRVWFKGIVCLTAVLYTETLTFIARVCV